MKLITCIACSLSLCALVACGDNTNEATSESDSLGPGEIAIVNGVRIPESVYRRFAVATTQRDVREMSDAERERIVEELIRIRLLAEAGERNGYASERTVAANLRIQRDQVLANEAASRFLQENPPTEAELIAAYETAVESLSGTEYKARHILLDTEEDAREVIALLEAGGQFADLAKEHSTGPTGPQGGDLGWLTPDSVVSPFAEAVQALPLGTYTSDPVQTQFGWHVILVEESREQDPPGLDSMRAELSTAVQRQKIEDYIESLRTAADVEVF
jgi:peptidyl-prolyl cis-trans isomerase C